MAQHSNWKTSGRKQEKGQSNASARTRQKRKQLKRLSQTLKQPLSQATVKIVLNGRD